MEELIYIASPFTTDCDEEKEWRFLKACDACGHLMQQGRLVYSPIAYGYPISKRKNLPTDWAYWKMTCQEMLSRCQILIVLMLPGWKESVGVLAEIKIAKELGLKIQYMDSDTYEIFGVCP